MKNKSFSFAQSLYQQSFFLLLFLGTFFLSCSNNSSYVDGMPTAENANNSLKTLIQATDPMNRCAKQVAALRQLNNIIRNIMARDRSLTEKESVLCAGYKKLAESIRSDYSNSLSSDILKDEFEKACKNWEEDGFLEDLVIDSLMSPQAKEIMGKKYTNIINEKPPDKKAMGRKYLFIGIAMFVGFALIGFKIGKDKLRRRNQHGVEEYKNYKSLVKSEVLEALLSWIAFFLVLIGFGFFIYGFIILIQ
jgi:uncharacterized membrane protein